MTKIYTHTLTSTTQPQLVEHLRPAYIVVWGVFGLGAIMSLIAIGTSADEYQTHYGWRFDSPLRV